MNELNELMKPTKYFHQTQNYFFKNVQK